MANYRTSLAFTRLSDSALVPFTKNALDQLTDNPGFPNPPSPLTAISAALDAFVAALAVSKEGGKKATVEKDNARNALEQLLRPLAAYIQTVAGNDLALLLSSGFEALSTNRAQVPLPKPVIESVENPASTQLALRLQPVYTSRAYEVRVSYGTSGWQTAGVFTQARRIILEDLTPGTTYTVQARAIGGSTGSSDWSDPVSHMSL